MADAGLVALDPVRLAGLESYLAGLADGMLHGAGDVEAALAGIEESADAAVAELRRLAGWCRTTGEGVARRRAIVEALPTALPRPDLVFASSAAAASEAAAVGSRLAAALDEDPPVVAVVDRLLSEVARGDHDPAFLVAVARRLGPGALLRLSAMVGVGPGGSPAVVRALMRALPPPPSPPPTEPTGGASDPALVWGVVRAAGVDVDDEQISLIEQAEQDLGFVLDGGLGLGGVARTLLRGAEGAVALTPLAGAGLVLDAVDLVDDPEAEEVLALVADALLVVAPGTGALAPLAFAAAAVAAVAGFALGRPWDLDDDDRDVRRDDDGDGTAAYPSGSDTNPEVDVAGVPLGPGYA